MKKLLALILALAMLLALTGCGSSAPAKSDSTPDFKKEAASAPEEPEEEAAPAESMDAEEAPAEDSTPADADVSEDADTDASDAEVDLEAMLGSHTSTTYTNEYFGFTCTLSEAWTISSDEELAEMNGIVAEEISDENLAQQLRDSGIVYDFLAISDSGNNINIVLQDIGIAYGIMLDEDTFVDSITEDLESNLESMGISDGKVAVDKLEFAGTVRPVVMIEGVLAEYDIPLYETMICCFDHSGKVALVTATAFDADSTYDMLNMFTAE